MLLQSKRAFYFCGINGHERYLNSIETIQLETDEEWKVLSLDERIKKSYSLGAISFEGGILVYGGAAPSPQVMYTFTEEGKLEWDLSSQDYIPRDMISESNLFRKAEYSQLERASTFQRLASNSLR